MSILKGILKVGLSPLNGLAEIVKDISGDNSQGEQALSIGTLGASSVVKGTAKGIKKVVTEIFD